VKRHKGSDIETVQGELRSLVDSLGEIPKTQIRSMFAPARGGCVYLLLRGGRVVYIGQSMGFMARISSHQKKGGWIFDEIQYLILPRRCLLWVEYSLIRKFRPPYNGQIPTEYEIELALLDAKRYLRQRGTFFKSRAVPSTSPSIAAAICEKTEEV
jgi:hypothetical protein